jgi:hypothetical protein
LLAPACELAAVIRYQRVVPNRQSVDPAQPQYLLTETAVGYCFLLPAQAKSIGDVCRKISDWKSTRAGGLA